MRIIKEIWSKWSALSSTWKQNVVLLFGLLVALPFLISSFGEVYMNLSDVLSNNLKRRRSFINRSEKNSVCNDSNGNLLDYRSNPIACYFFDAFVIHPSSLSLTPNRCFYPFLEILPADDVSSKYFSSIHKLNFN